MQRPTPTRTARPPIRTKKPGLRKNGASAREYGCGRRPPERLRGSLALRRGSGVEIATAAAALRAGATTAIQCRGSFGGRLLLGELVGDVSEREEPPGQLGVVEEGL